jgi:hypothetical protein
MNQATRLQELEEGLFEERRVPLQELDALLEQKFPQ